MRVLVQHRSRYSYPSPATLGPQLIRLRPAQHTKARIETYGLHIKPTPTIRWQQDPNGNFIARASFEDRPPTTEFEVLVEMAVDIHQINPFDFFLDSSSERIPFEYPKNLAPELLQYLAPIQPCGPETRLGQFLAGIPREGYTVASLVRLNSAVKQAIRYIIREEAGVWTPEETLTNGRGSCRDSALLLVACLREWGLAARFVSGYSIQLADEGLIPDQPKGVGRDVVDLHAWAEVYLPGAGWIGLDGTSGLFCGEGHIPLASSASPLAAGPIEGTTDIKAEKVSFEVTVGRLGHEPRPTVPFAEETWESLLSAADRADAVLKIAGLRLTCGGEPTFNAREHVDRPEWNTDALGPSKWSHGLRLVEQLRQRLAPGAAVIAGQGKQYPGEPLPRWALEICGRRDGRPLWRGDAVPRPGQRQPGIEEARAFAGALARQLDLPGAFMPAFEDPFPAIIDEVHLPLDVDPLKADLKDSADRRRLARLLERGLQTEAGFVLPITPHAHGWRTESWRFRREHLFLIPGDSPIGLRLPLRSLPFAELPPVIEESFEPADPRREPEKTKQARAVRLSPTSPRPAPSLPIRTALCVEPREGALRVFLPPLPELQSFFRLVEVIDAAREESGLSVLLEGYGPPSGPELFRFAVTPDPGVLEVNLPPVAGTREYGRLVETVFDAALHAGLQSEKYLIDGRLSGSGGGNHITLGGPTPLQSPFVKRPDLLASLVTFAQHHPSLSYLFTGLFVGPTSQAPRMDEARHDALEALEIAGRRAFDRRDSEPPWLSDMLFRNILVDIAGNTHRAEICIDKLFGAAGPSSRQGLIELRAFEMPPHHRLMVAQLALMRALTASFVNAPYDRAPVRWGQALHDRFLLPQFLWRDFEDVLAHLGASGVPLPTDAYRAFLELRCPLAGTLQFGDLTVAVRNALEPWPVLGEELSATGTSRFVDSSMERIEVLVDGLVPERHAVTVNGQRLPLHPTERAGRFVAGVRFRAWAPPHSLHAHLGIHHPLRIDVLDTWANRSVGACAYHVWHPEGRAFDQPPLTRSEAVARRSRRFTIESPMPWPARVQETAINPNEPYTLDLRRFPMDRPMPEEEEEEDGGGDPGLAAVG
jgi:uncharacterized protein (DUF2126 family)/transglutaminase-like putative cysteine protease